jgi:hypothetical protein
MLIDFDQIRPFIPGWVFNEYGQLTGNFVHYGEIVCDSENGRIRVWLNRAAYDSKDPERLICDYDEGELRGMR